MQTKPRRMNKKDEEVFNGMVQKSIVGATYTKAAMETIKDHVNNEDFVFKIINGFILDAFTEGWEYGAGRFLKFSEKEEAHQQQMMEHYMEYGS